MQFYFDPEREQDPYALPDAETFELHEQQLVKPDEDEWYQPGWYWHACFPGCLPDGPPFGAFDTEELAIADARESAGVA